MNCAIHCAMIFVSVSLTLTIFLGVFITSIEVIHSHIVLPTCALPFMRSSRFCDVVRFVDGGSSTEPQTFSSQQDNPHPQSSPIPFFCFIPGISSTYICERSTSTDKAHEIRSSEVPEILSGQFQGFAGLAKISSQNPKFTFDIRDIVMALDDLIILVKHSGMEKKDAIVTELEAIKVAGKNSSRHLQAYSTRLAAAITLILVSAEYTLSLAEASASVGSSSLFRTSFCFIAAPFNICSDDRAYAQTQNAFLHTMQTFESLIRNLMVFNLATDESLIVLDGHIVVVSHLIGEEMHHASMELGELLGRLWTRLGGNRNRLAETNSRFLSLTHAGQQTRAMKALVWDVRIELDGLQENTDALRAYAAEPLLLDGRLPKADVIRALSDGCQHLRSRALGSLGGVNVIEDDRHSVPVAISVP